MTPVVPALPFPCQTSAGGVAGNQRKFSGGMLIALLLWLAVVGSATVQMIRYSNASGKAGPSPVVWPEHTQIPFDDRRPTLVMFAHPRCPCTRASLGELERLLAQLPGQLSAHVVFLKPEDTDADWEKTGLWRKASSIPGVAVHTDDQGREARRFHAETSGQTLLYDQTGALRFQGGITSARGHEGDNPGRTALQKFAQRGDADQLKTPVFGCALFSTECQQGETLCHP